MSVLFCAKAYAYDTVSGFDQTWCPDWDGGDREFYGYGPHVTGTVSLRLNSTRTRLYVEVYAEWDETAGDGTHATLEVEKTILTEAAGFSSIWINGQWKSVSSTTMVDQYAINYIDTDTTVDQFSPGKSWLSTVDIMGDTVDNDVGYNNSPGCNNIPTDSHIRIVVPTLYYILN